ncbi:hypothetical protein BDN67DRAFT_1004415 [Paxillus ammoniavirescens]|nr:hypothetical protein BDN67DRAFT_1004415 [Paxillus ammoniavirescens]
MAWMYGLFLADPDLRFASHEGVSYRKLHSVQFFRGKTKSFPDIAKEGGIHKVVQIILAENEDSRRPEAAIEQEGLIVNIGSTAGSITMPCNDLFSAAKTALHAIFEDLAMSCKPVNVMFVVPAGITTDILKHQAASLELSSWSWTTIMNRRQSDGWRASEHEHGRIYTQRGGRILLVYNHRRPTRKEVTNEEKLARSGTGQARSRCTKVESTFLSSYAWPLQIYPTSTLIARVSSTPKLCDLI